MVNGIYELFANYPQILNASEIGKHCGEKGRKGSNR